MSSINLAPISMPARGGALAWRLALRELRGGLSGFRVFMACIALGVMAIAGVGSFAESLSGGLAREGRTILGGDMSFSLIHREADAKERAFLEAQGRLSVAATMRAMARMPDGRSSLVELKAVDAAYPLYGATMLDPEMSLRALLAPHGQGNDRVFGAAADVALLARHGLEPGARIVIGGATLEIRAVLRNEPDKLAGGIGFGPRVLTSEAALRATGLLQPGSLVRWHYRLRLPGAAGEAAEQAVIQNARATLPDAGWEIRTRSNASPQLERNINRFTQYLTLVGLTALLVGGVGVANAVRSHLDRRRDAIATMKALGATGGRVFTIYLTQVLAVAFVAAVIGTLLGAFLPFAISWIFGSIIPLPIAPALHPPELALAVLYGVLTALAFALWPLARAHDVSVASLFRDEVATERKWPRPRYVAATGFIVALLAVLAVMLAYDRRIAAIFVASAAAVFVALRLFAMLLMLAARRSPRPRAIVLRYALANIHRPGALTQTVVLSVGIGLALLVTVIQVDGNLRRQFIAALPDNAPSFYFVDIPSADAQAFGAFVRERAPRGALENVPMLRGRIVAANRIPAEEIKPAPNAAWVLQSDRGITYAGEVPRGSRVVEGEWWNADYDGPPLVSLEKRIADGLGLKIGDRLTVNVLGRNIAAEVANLRTVDWQGLGINFVLVYSPNTFRGAPHTYLATLTYPHGSATEEETALLRAVSDAYPTVTTVRVKDAIEAVGGIVTNLVRGIRGASVLTLVIAALVLGGALAAGHRYRVYDAVVLKTFGATRARLLGAFALEYVALGLATALFGVAAGSLAAWVIVREVMNLPFVFLPGPAGLAALAALAVTVALGLVGTYSALGQKPAAVLRNL